jgi:O-antigen ligase
MLKVMLPFYVGITTINSSRELRILCWTIVLSQGYLAFEMNVSYLRGFNAMALGATGLENNSAAIAMAAGAGFSVMIGFLAPNRFQKCVAIVCAALMVHAIMMSDSRGGMLGIVLTGVAVLILTPKNPRTVFAFIVIGLLVLRFTGPAVMERFSTAFADEEERDDSAASRIYLWQDCHDLIKKRPILGVGPHHWRAQYAESYGWPAGKSAHSTWLEIAAETGIPGALFLIGFYGSLAVLCWRWIRTDDRLQDPLIHSTCCAAIVGTVGFAVSASFVTYWGSEISYYIVLAGAAALRLSSLTMPSVQPLPSLISSSQPYAQRTA